jgi:Spy/CpxP family protein refolding chaperone
MKFDLRFISVRSISMMTAVAAVCLVFVSDANAQRGGGGFGRGPQLMSSLLSMEEVQKELELTDEQIEEVVAPAAQLNDDLRAEMRELRDADPSEIAALVKEMREEEGEIIAKLNDDQKNRLKQLNYQRMGPRLLTDEGAQKDLELTEDQIAKITEASAAMREKAMELFQSGGGEGMREKMDELQEEMQKTLDSILTDEQNEKLVELKGEEFKFPERQPREGGRRSDF